jgi:hypothetical protein
LLSSHWLPPETTLLVELEDDASSPPRVLVLHVRHATSAQAGRYLIGGSLSNRLSQEDLASLLAAHGLER